MAIFSSPEQLEKIKNILSRYIRLPFSGETIPGAIMEATLARVRGGQVLNTYDFVDVIKMDEHLGWQVKSTKEGTPVTWKRAKIPDRPQLIEESFKNQAGLQKLGDAIIDFCNRHAKESLEKYNLNSIGYSRLIIHDSGKVTYFEKELCIRSKPEIFDPQDFEWKWSTQKQVSKKEQLRALHGFHRKTGKKFWAWHGLGENQLHFSGESNWWPGNNDSHTIAFRFPTERERISLDKFMELLSRLDMPN